MEKKIEDLKDEHNLKEEPEKEDSRFIRIIKKIILIFISLFLLFLFLSYFLPSYNLFSIISAQANSYKISQNIIILKNNDKIVFENNAYGDLLEIYNENQQHEFKACLVGDKEENVYRIDEIKIPKIISQDFSSVRAVPCSKDTIISLHSHPYKSCYFSVHDVNSYRLVKSFNEEALIGIMCEQDRFNFYGFG